MYPVYLKIKNFLSFEDQEYNFDNDNAYLIQGINNTKDSQQSNGSGKSSLQSAIEYAITKTTSRKCRDINLVRRGQNSPAYVELHLHCPSRKETLIIVRTIPLKGSTTCDCYVGESKEENKVPLANVADADNYILNWIDIEKEDLQNYFIINRERYTSFFSSSNTKKLALVARFSNTSPIDKMVANVLIKVGEKEKEISASETKKIGIESKIELINEQIQKEEERDIEKEIEEEVEKIENSIFDKQEDIKLNSSIILKNEKSTLEKQAILDDLVIDLDKVSGEVKKLQKNTLNADIQEKKNEIKDQEKIKEDIDELKRDFNNTISFIDKGLSKIEVKLAGTITCPKCSHEFLLDDDVNLEDLKNEVKELTLKKEEQSKSLKETKELELDISKAIELINKDLNSLKLKEEENDSAIRKLRYKLNTVEENIGTTKGDILSLQQSNKHLKEKNVQIEESIVLLKEQIEKVKTKSVDSSIIEGLQDNLFDYKESLKKVEKEIQQKQDELFEIKQWETNFKRFKSYLAQKSLLTIQAKINEQLKLMKSDLRIKLEGFKEKADGTLKEEITPLIIDNGEIVEFSALSGGERVRVDFATILVLQEIINSTHKYGGLNLLFVDEITEGVDPLGLKLLMKSMPENKSIFVITHIAMDSMYDHILTIENNNGISIIK